MEEITQADIKKVKALLKRAGKDKGKLETLMEEAGAEMQTRLGEMYEFGRGVKRNNRKAA